MRMRESNEEARVAEDGLHTGERDMAPPIAKVDFGRRSGIAPLPSQPGNRPDGGPGESDSAPGSPQRPTRDLGPITSPVILERKKLIDRLTAEFHGMLMIDRPHGGVEVDLDRMMYVTREDGP